MVIRESEFLSDLMYIIVSFLSGTISQEFQRNEMAGALSQFSEFK